MSGRKSGRTASLKVASALPLLPPAGWSYQAWLTTSSEVAEGEAWRATPQPDTEEMAEAMDGGMVNIREEG